MNESLFKGYLASISREVGIVQADLLEKDHHLQMMLLTLQNDHHLREHLVFKGGTCLIKTCLGKASANAPW